MDSARSWRGVCLYTVGHSTRSLDELIALLRAFEVTVLVDIRTIPRSRHNPHFDKAALGPALRSRRLRYVHVRELGGLRRPRKDSANAGFRNASFRGFADYMLTEEFESGLAKLRAVTSGGRVALMCAEAVPWRCHRSLIADVLTARGARVEHIIGSSRSRPHRVTGFARVEGTRVTYPDAGVIAASVSNGLSAQERKRIAIRREAQSAQRLGDPRARADRKPSLVRTRRRSSTRLRAPGARSGASTPGRTVTRSRRGSITTT